MEKRQLQSLLVTYATHYNCSDYWNVLESTRLWLSILDDCAIVTIFWNWNTCDSLWLWYPILDTYAIVIGF